ncbi:FAD-binding oxidoreductase [Alphaproteobacteria bacterium KMM 3653]|uniref:FAD-binding oxidoreductase n=1 Tax=Harenicola maris TaxID=2841044 RepID=A0AAP2CJZ1_9RHOB|nr:FAD-binding oxidoreductase [Harenicola maris]
MQDFDLIIAGAGIVGTSAALMARMEGMSVLLCDGETPGSGTVSGSACTIATYANVPINSPSIFAALPTLLTSADSPLTFNWKYGLQNPRWMLSFLRNCRSAKVEEIAANLGRLLAKADESIDALTAESGAEDLFVQNDCLYIWSTKAGFDAARAGNEMRKKAGVTFDELTEEEVRTLEPAIQGPVHGGLQYKGARHVLDPQALTLRYHARYLALGGAWAQSSMTQVQPDATGVTVTLADGTQVRGKRCVIAAGAHSTRIRGTGAERLPLGVERGYNILYPQSSALTSRPVGWAEAGFYATPMAQGLRIAGTVEIASLYAPFNSRNTDYLHRKSKEMFAPLGAPDKPWLGYRPTMPDALPVIGFSPTSDNVILAFGHQHIGLTLGPLTGRIVADLALGKKPNIDIAAFSPKRF